MADGNVTIDPGFRSPNSTPGGDGGPTLGWVGIAMMVVVAVGLGWLLRSPAPGTSGATDLDPLAVTTMADGPVAPPVTSGRPASAAQPAPQRPPDSDQPLHDVMPGFADTLTTLTWGIDGVHIVRWRASQSSPETVLSLDHEDGWNRSVDSSGRWVVEIQGDSGLRVRAVDGDRTWSGALLPPEAMGGAWSAVWHDTRPGLLAWMACPAPAAGAPSTLYSIDVSADAADLAESPLGDFTCPERGVSLARWGDWGILLHTTDRSGTAQVLLDRHGRELAQGRFGPEGEWFVGVGPGAATVWTQGVGRIGSSSFLLSPEGHQRRPVPGLADDERLEIAVASPDGSYLALIPDLVANFGSVVRIVAVDSDSVLAEIAEPEAWVSRMVWSSDSRFLIYERWPDVKLNWAGVPRGVELVFYDTEAKTGVAVSFPGYAPALRTAP